jgi:hypothetical protein
MALRVAAWLVVLAQAGWFGYGAWLWAFGTRCEVDCELNAYAYYFWFAIEVIVLPIALVGGTILFRGRRRRVS